MTLHRRINGSTCIRETERNVTDVKNMVISCIIYTYTYIDNESMGVFD